jgi:hypothetical protein
LALDPPDHILALIERPDRMRDPGRGLERLTRVP